MLTISVVSHRHGVLVKELLGDIQRHVRLPVSIILTINVQEPLEFRPGDYAFPLDIVHNPTPKGFGANHNVAFARCNDPYFCILNPDISFRADPFSPLVAALRSDAALGIVSPLVRNSAAEVEATSRRFPTPQFILRKALFGPPKTPDYPIGRNAISADWIGGMFMLMPAKVFSSVGGFDERYFMYYEDVDLCARVRAAGFDIRLDPAASVVHAARRDSHRRPRYLLWHLRSMLRFWYSHPYVLSRRSKSPQRKKEKTAG
jgi:hypothetical protein